MCVDGFDDSSVSSGPDNSPCWYLFCQAQGEIWTSTPMFVVAAHQTFLQLQGLLAAYHVISWSWIIRSRRDTTKYVFYFYWHQCCSSQSHRTPEWGESNRSWVKSESQRSVTQLSDLSTNNSARTSVLHTLNIGSSRDPRATQAKVGTLRPWK